ncbi:hypothetical protein [Actinokineospora sp. HUAS TT18]|uniref:hypothetical protein n=1 Tax=Actinokineospora sp. HUAS TT18 TaxID=3447451 RepID=UPI003F525E4F
MTIEDSAGGADHRADAKTADPESWPGLAYRVLQGTWRPLVKALLFIAVLALLGVAAVVVIDGRLGLGPVELER